MINYTFSTKNIFKYIFSKALKEDLTVLRDIPEKNVIFGAMI